MFKKMSKALTRTDIAEIEANPGFTFPEDFVEHYLFYNGGIPAKPFFYSESEDIETEVQVFLPLKNQCCDIPIKNSRGNIFIVQREIPVDGILFSLCQ